MTTILKPGLETDFEYQLKSAKPKSSALPKLALTYNIIGTVSINQNVIKK